MAEKIGLEAVLELGGFRSAVSHYNSAISGMSKNTVSVASSISSSFLGLGNSILNIGMLAGGAALAGVAALGAGLATFAVSGIKQAIDLDQQVANIAATMGATRETAGTLKEELKGLALDLSLDPNLTVDVTQAGQAIEVLAASGALATDEFGKLTQASKDLAIQTVALANATGSDFTTAATIATDAAALFNLQANEMGKAVDGAAGIMNASKFDAQDYQLALSNAGGIAAEMGLSIEDFNTVIAGTASNFASGSDAGTSFKTLLQRLANPTDEVKAAMQQYGISLFDAEGNMRDMADVAQDLNQVFNGTVTVTSQVGGATKEQAKAAEQASGKISDLTRDIGQQEAKLKLMNDVYQESLKFYDAGEPKMRAQALAIEKLSSNITDQKEKLGGYQQAISLVDGAQARTVTSTQQLTEAQKAQLAATLGGSDGARILLGLADLTAEEFDALSESVNRTGQGMEAAALRVDTVKGAMDIFKGVLQAVMIQVGDKFLPLLKDMAVGFTQLAAQIGPQAVAFFGQVSDSIGQIILRGQELFAIFQAEGGGGLLAALGIGPDGIELFGKVSTLITDIATSISSVLTPALSSLTSGGIIDGINTGLTFLNQHFEEFKGAIIGIGVVLAGGVFAALAAGILSLLTPINLIIAGAALLGAAWAGNWGNIQGIVGSAVTYITEQFNALITLVQPAITSFQESFARLSATFVQTGVDSSVLTTILSTMGNFIVETLIPAWVQWIGFLTGVAATAFSAWVTYIQTAYSAFQFLSGFIESNVIPALVSMSDEVALVGELIGSVLAFNIAVASKSIEAMAGLWKNVLWPSLQKVGQFLKDTIMPAFVSMGTTVKSDVSPVLKELGETVLPLLNEGLTFVIQSIKDAIGYFNSLKEAVNSFSLPDILTPGSPPPMAYALWDIGKGASDAASAITGMGDAMAGVNPKQFLDAMNVGGQMHALGASNVNDLKDIFKLNSQAVMDILGSGGGEGELSALLGQQAAIWNVPPQFAQELAQANGLFGQLIDQYGEFARATRLENLGRLTQMAASFAGLGGNFAGMLEEQMASKDAAKKTAEAYRKLTDGIATQEDQLTTLQAELATLTSANELDTAAIEKKQKAIEELTKAMDKNRQAASEVQADYATLQAQAFDLFSGNQTDTERITSELATIALLEDFLKSGEDKFLIPADAVSQAAGITGILYDQISGQQELNRLLAEQARREELITAQKEAQQKLDFLKSQLDLINLGRQLGGNIFQGITFGLDASVEDLLAATNAVTQAMVNQINEDLQIASPSKVMIKTFKQVMAGAAIGMERGQSMLTNTMRNIPLLNGSMPVFSQQGGATSNNQNTYNYNMPMTVNTSASASGVIRQYEIKRSMYAN